MTTVKADYAMVRFRVGDPEFWARADGGWTRISGRRDNCGPGDDGSATLAELFARDCEHRPLPLAVLPFSAFETGS